MLCKRFLTAWSCHRASDVTVTRVGRGTNIPNIHTGTPTHTHKDAVWLENTSPLLKEKDEPKYSCCSSQ